MGWRLPRRTVLRGLGAAIGLPWLEAMARPARAAAAPLRLAFVYVPNGANMADWTPDAEGTAFTLPFVLEPLGPLRDDVLVLSGLAHHEADVRQDGGGDHARASATFLTGARARKTAARDVRVGISVDQVAARHLGALTRLPSLELGCDRGQQAGTCDSGYSCAYQFNLAWQTETLPLPPETDPRAVFERLFGGDEVEDAGQAARRRAAERSVLDFVLDDLRRLERRVGAADRRKLGEYANALREVEARIQRSESIPPPPSPRVSRPAAAPADYRQHIRTVFDLLALAFQSDVTRVATFMVAHDGSNRSYPFIGVPDGHHDISHHGGNAEKKARIARINRFHLEQFAHFLARLRGTREGEGTLLDSCLLVYGSGISDGDRHNHDELPVLLAGRGGGIRPGRHVRFARHTPMSNLYVSLLERVGVRVQRFGDSTGALAGL